MRVPGDPALVTRIALAAQTRSEVWTLLESLVCQICDFGSEALDSFAQRLDFRGRDINLVTILCATASMHDVSKRLANPS
jgi:hypothetical protein